MTVLIKNVRLIDGVHDFPERSDVFVANGLISAIGNFPNKRADDILDGQGAFLAPGFIDVNTASDHYLTLFNYPSQADFLRQGVTTIFGGMSGSSLAPLLYGGLESIRKWGNTDKANVSWHTVGEFLKAIDAHPLAVNFGTLAGHATIRRAIVGDAIRDLTKREREVFSRVLREALREGAFGLSTGLSYVHARKTPESELIALARIVKAEGGIYATNLRNSGIGIQESVAETIRLAKEAGVNTLISHFAPEVAAGHEYESAVKSIDELSGGVRIRFDTCPFPMTLVPLYAFLPQWAQAGGWESMLPNLKDEWFLSRIKKDMAAMNGGDFVVAQAPGNDILVGRTLDDLKAMFDVPTLQDAILKLMASTGLRGIVAYRNLDESLIRKVLANPRSFVASSAPSFDASAAPLRLKTELSTSTFTKFLSLVDQDNLMPLKDAVRKLSYEPALMFGLAGRGELREGAVADLACFKDADVKFTVVNGRAAFKNGEFQNIFAGNALRRH